VRFLNSLRKITNLTS